MRLEESLRIFPLLGECFITELKLIFYHTSALNFPATGQCGVVSREASNKLLAGTDRCDATVFPNLRTWISISQASLEAAGTR